METQLVNTVWVEGWCICHTRWRESTTPEKRDAEPWRDELVAKEMVVGMTIDHHVRVVWWSTWQVHFTFPGYKGDMGFVVPAAVLAEGHKMASAIWGKQPEVKS